MARNPYIFTQFDPQGDTLSVTGAEAKHLVRVLRAQPGYLFTAFDGAGHVCQARVKTATKNQIEAEILEHAATVPEPLFKVEVAVGIVKGSRMDFAVEKAAELGASRFIPLLTDFNVINPGQSKVERWQTMALAAAKQSRQSRIMSLAEPCHLPDLLSGPDQMTDLLFHDDRDDHQHGRALVRLTKCLETFDGIDGLKDGPHILRLWIGPEGGFSNEELQLFRTQKITQVSLGSGILRTETAVAVALGLVNQVMSSFVPQPGAR